MFAYGSSRNWQYLQLMQAERNSLALAKEDILTLKYKVLEFVHERRKNGQPVTSDTIRNKAKEVAKVLNMPNQEFKAL